MPAGFPGDSGYFNRHPRNIGYTATITVTDSTSWSVRSPIRKIPPMTTIGNLPRALGFP